MIDMLNKNEVLRYLGCKSADDSVLKMIEECEVFLKKICIPRYVYKIFDVKVTSNGTVVDGGVVFEGEDIKKHLSKSHRCVVLAATLGLEADREIKRLEITSVTKALVLDACATAYIEQVCDEVQNEIFARYGSVNYRYSPGYGDFSIEAQKDVLRLLDTQRKIGLTLSDGGMLIPSKSVTAVLGCVDNDGVCGGSKCERCPNKMRCEYSNEN